MKSLKEEAMENLKAMGSTPIEGGKSTPSAAHAFLGAISAGVIALILYKFTLTIESSLNRQTISDNFSVSFFFFCFRPIFDHPFACVSVLLLIIFCFESVGFWQVLVPLQVRQITVTIRTIINGICNLATFVFGINAIGLLLYSGQLAFSEDSDEKDIKVTTEPGDSSGDNSQVNNSSNEDQSSGD